MERLTKRTENGITENYETDELIKRNGQRACMEKLADYEDAEENGLLVKMLYGAKNVCNQNKTVLWAYTAINLSNIEMLMIIAVGVSAKTSK